MLLKSKFTALFMIFLITFGLINIYIAWNEITGTIIGETLRSSEFFATYLSQAIFDYMLEGDFLSVYDIIHKFKESNPNIIYVYVIDFEGKVIADTFGEGFPRSLLGFNPPSDTISVKEFKTGGNRIFDISAPAVKGVGGEIHIGISRDMIEKLSEKVVNKMMLWGFPVVIIGGLIVFMFMHTITKPLKQLVSGVERIIHGDYKFRLEANTHDEVGQLSIAFNDMLTRLDEKDKEIKEYTEKLKAIIKKLNKSRNELKVLIESLEDGVIYVSHDGTIRLWNRAAEKLFGIDKKKTIGRKITELIPLSDALRNFTKFELKLGANGEEPRIIKLITAQIVGKANDRIIIARDVTQEKIKMELDKKLRQYEKIGFIGQLAAGVIHSINTPLTSIMLSAELLLMECQDRSVKERIKDIITKVETCKRIVSGLLDFVRERAEVKREPTNILTLIERSLETNVPPLENKNIKIERVYEGDKEYVLSVDPVGMQLVFDNIIMNAVQAMPEGGTLKVEIGQDSENVYVSISDTGVGISRDDLKKLFEPFFSTKRDKGGTGLGLSISREIVKAHGGEIIVKSELGKGSTFTVRLPRGLDD